MMLLSSLVLLASVAVPAPSLSATTGLVQIRPTVGGGYRAVDVTDDDVQTAARMAAESVDAEVSDVISAERQTVAGVNFRISFTTTDGARYNAVVFHGLDRSWRVTSIDEVGDTGSNEGSEDE